MLNYKLNIALVYGLLMLWQNASAFDQKTPEQTKLQDYFIENQGQFAPIEDSLGLKIYFRAELNGMSVFFAESRLVYILQQHIPQTGKSEKERYFEQIGDHAHALAEAYERSKTQFFRLDVALNDQLSVPPKAETPAEHSTNYYLAHCAEGIIGTRSFSTIRYKNLYTGVDFVYRIVNGLLKYDIEVQNPADLAQISMNYCGQTDLKVGRDSIVLRTPLGEIYETIPFSYIPKSGKSVAIGFNDSKNGLGFRFSDKTTSDPIVIDPVIYWSTYFEALPSGTMFNYTNAHDGMNFYLSGYTSTQNIPALNPGSAYTQSNAGSNDLYLVQFDDQLALNWVTYYGGSNNDYQFNGGMAADPGSGVVYIAGKSSSTDFPVQSAGGYFDGTHNGGEDGVIVKFNGSSGARIWATYFGGASSEMIRGLDVDPSGNLFCTGETYSASGFPLKPKPGAYYDGVIGGSQDGFLARFSSATAQQWTTYFGGTSFEFGGKVHYSSGGKLVCVLDASSGLATTLNPGGGAYFDTSPNGSTDMSIAKFNGTTLALEWATLMGGNYNDNMNDGTIVSRSNGNITLVTRSASDAGTFPTFNAGAGSWYQANGGGNFNYHGLIAEFSPSGQRQWVTFYGATTSASTYFYEGGYNMADDLYIAGQSTDPAVAVAESGSFNDLTHAGSSDAIVGRFDGSSRNIEWLTYLGTGGGDVFYAIEVLSDNPCGNYQLYCSGITRDGITAIAEVNPGGGAYIDHQLTGVGSASLLARFDAGSSPATGTTWTWVGGVSGSADDWHEPCNWDKGSVPNSTSTVFVPGGTHYNPRVYAPATANCSTLTLDELNGAEVTIESSTGARLIVNQ